MAISISLVILLGLLSDYVFRRCKLPGLVGMLLAGVVCGPYVLDLIAPEMMTVSADFRRIALIVILLRAGFELHRDTLNRVGRAALLMSSIPALFEIGGIMLVAPPLLHMSLLEAALLGSILAAVSPAVVVPLMIDFMDRGRGAKKGLPTLILAASSIDDVFVIVLFSIFLGMYGQADVHIWAKLGEIPLSMALGILTGIIPGYILYKLFTRYDWRSPKRTIVVMGTAIFITWLESAVEPWVPMAGLLGVMAIGFIILEKSEAIAQVISQKLKKLWVFAELLLFVLVGAQVDIQVAWDAGFACMVVIAVGLVFRRAGTYLSLVKTPFAGKEKLFSIVAYVPKATVQAAIGAVPLAAGVASGEVILAVAVLSIIVTAPLGAVGIKVLGEKILDYGDPGPIRFRQVRETLQLPRVGERVRDKHSNTVWKVIEEKEQWVHPVEGEGGIEKIPAIELRFWKEGAVSGAGKTVSRRYSRVDSSFHEQWEVLYDW